MWKRIKAALRRRRARVESFEPVVTVRPGLPPVALSRIMEPVKPGTVLTQEIIDEVTRKLAAVDYPAVSAAAFDAACGPDGVGIIRIHPDGRVEHVTIEEFRKQYPGEFNATDEA